MFHIKIFEKLILKRVLDIQDEAGVDLTGADQHGFKRKCRTQVYLLLKKKTVELLQVSRRQDKQGNNKMSSVNLPYFIIQRFLRFVIGFVFVE